MEDRMTGILVVVVWWFWHGMMVGRQEEKNGRDGWTVDWAGLDGGMVVLRAGMGQDTNLDMVCGVMFHSSVS